MLILFVAMFSVVLGLAAFAIDQGFWFGRRTIAETAASAAARSGAIAFFGDQFTPCENAAQTAAENGIDVPNPDWCNDDPNATETRFSTQSYHDALTGKTLRDCVLAQIDTELRSLFSGAFGIDKINVGASSRACAGTSLDIRAAAGVNGPQGLPVVLADGGSKDCFQGNNLAPGRECVVWSAMSDNSANRLLWTDEAECSDGNVTGSAGQLQNGVAWTCRDGDAIRTSYISRVSSSGVDQEDVRSAFRARLQRATTCMSATGNPASFQNAFGNGDGSLGDAPGLPPFGGSADPEYIYVQNDCFNNPRIVIVPITSDRATTSGSKDISGFAIVYITGCYQSGRPTTAPESDTCSNWPAAQLIDRVANCTALASDFCKYEVRGVPVRVFITSEAAGRLGDMDDNNFPLTIQTVE